LSLKPIHCPALSGDVKTSQADITLIKKLLGWQPKTKLENWLIEVISSKNFEDI
jgi:nucleoside-diphosphate-sugar epimerase